MNGIKIACPNGDKRLLHAARVLISAGFDVIFPQNKVIVPDCDGIVLPIPSNRFIDERAADFNVLLSHLKKNGRIFSSCPAYIEKLGVHPKELLFDYTSDEDFVSINTIATCEGALSIIISNTDKTIRCSKVLLTGWGKISKCLFQMLRKLNANVTVAARNPLAIGEVCALGSEGVYFRDIYKAIDASDVIVNTVPHPVIDTGEITGDVTGKLFLELASPPYGFDSEEMAALGAKSIIAPSLPTKYAPESSGKALGRAICRLCSEGKEL